MPGRLCSLSAVPGNEIVASSWTGRGGGFPITGWQFRLATDDGAFTEPGPAWVAIPGSGTDTTAYTEASLDNASQYELQARAVNGPRVESASAAVTPIGDPAASMLGAHPGTAQVALAVPSGTPAWGGRPGGMSVPAGR